MKKQNEHDTPWSGISPELVARAKSGDQTAFTALYQQTSPALYRSVRAMIHDEDLAWDILQDSYLRVFRNMKSLEADEAFLPWLRRIAVNETARRMAKRLPLCFSELGDGEEEAFQELPDLRIESQPELALDRKESSRLVREILEALPEQQQLIVGMYYYEELGIREIAELLRLPSGTVKSQLYRGRRKVETRVRELEKQGVRLYGLGPIPFLLALLRRLEPAEAAETQTLRAVMTGLPATGAGSTAAGSAAAVTAMTTGQALLHGLAGKLLVGALALALIGGGVWAGGKLLRKQTPVMGDYRPTEAQVLGTLEEAPRTTQAPADAESSEDLTIPDPAETLATEPPTEPPAPVDPTDPWSLLGVLYDEDLGDGHVFRLPRFLADTEDADAMNAEIDRRFGETVRCALEDVDESHARFIDFEACVWEDVLTAVVIEDVAEYYWTDYAVYCYEVSTGKRLTTAALLEKMGISEADFLEACRKRLRERFSEVYGTVETQKALSAEAYQQMLDRQCSDEYVNLELMAYPQDGELWVIAPALSIAGAEYYLVPLCLDFSGG